MPYAYHLSYTCTAQQLHDLMGLVLERVRLSVSRLIGATVAKEVRCEHAVPKLREVRKLASPVICGRGKAVQEEDGRLFRPVRAVMHVAVGPAGGKMRSANVWDVAGADEIGLRAQVSNVG